MRINEISSNQNPAPKYKECYSEKYGRYMVAAKNITGGEVILRENPVAVGSALFNDNCLCFACLRIIPKVKIINLTIVCSGCNVAVFCSTNCETNKFNHSVEECQLFKEKLTSNNVEQLNMKNVLLPLRLLLIKKKDDELWNKIMKLEAHLDVRRNTPVWKECEENVINHLKAFNLINESEYQDNELLQQLCGILDVNCFELRSPGSLDNPGLRGVYIQAALMAHDCRGNTYLTVDDKFELTIYASQPIKEGELILFNYTSSILGTAERRTHLRQGKYFECDCKLCEDPDELGTNLSTLVCPGCKKGLIRFEDTSNKNVYASKKNWKCKMCGKLLSGRLIKTTLELGKSKMDELEDVHIKEMEAFLQKLSLTFHPNHFLMLTLKQKILELYRHEAACLNPRKQALLRITELCKEILEVLEIVEPGLSRLKGIMLYELHLPTIILANRNYLAREITLEEFIKCLEEAESYLKRSLSMILLEPATTPEGLLAKRAIQDLRNIRQNLDDVKSLKSSTESKQLNSSKNNRKDRIRNKNKKQSIG